MRKLVISAIAFFLFLSSFQAIVNVAIASSQKVPVIIRFKDMPDAELLTMFGGNIEYVYNIIPAVACSVSQASLSALKGNPLVAYVQQDNVVRILQEQLPWGVDRIDAEIVHRYNKGNGVKIAVIDTGIDYDHPDLDGNVAGGKSFVSYTLDYMDDHGHGTHVAGIIAAEDNDIGVVGVAPEARLYALKALDSEGSGYISDIVAAIDWAVANGIQIISMSFGSNSDDASMREACNNAYNAGVLLVAAAGNDGYWGRDTVDYPARYDSVIAVAATDQNNNRAYWSSRGPSLELAAPGVSIYSTYLDNAYATASGTSMACPHVSGVAALVFNSPIDPAYDLDNDGVWDASEVRRKLRDTADDLGYAGWDSSYGWGLVDADEAAPEPEDATPPGKVTGLTVTTVSQSQLSLSWNANFEEDMHHYNVYRSTSSGFSCVPENRVASVVSNSYLDMGLAASTTYYYRVTAVDLAGNEGEPSDEAYGTTSEDAIGPVVSAVAVNPNPTNGAMLVALTATVDDSAYGGSIIVDAEYFVDVIGENGTGFSMSASDGVFDSVVEIVSANIDVSSWTLGDHTIYVHGMDANGNWGAVSSVVLHVTEAVAYVMHVENIAMSKETLWFLKRAVAVVTIFDANGNPVEGATVYGAWSGLTSESESGVTGADGKVTFYTNWIWSGTGKCVFTVTNVVKAGWTYDPNANNETSDSIVI